MCRSAGCGAGAPGGAAHKARVLGHGPPQCLSTPPTCRRKRETNGCMQDAGQGHLAKRLTKNVGFGMGLEFREAANSLTASSSAPVRAGMIFNVSIGANFRQPRFHISHVAESGCLRCRSLHVDFAALLKHC